MSIKPSLLCLCPHTTVVWYSVSTVDTFPPPLPCPGSLVLALRLVRPTRVGRLPRPVPLNVCSLRGLIRCPRSLPADGWLDVMYWLYIWCAHPAMSKARSCGSCSFFERSLLPTTSYNTFRQLLQCSDKCFSSLTRVLDSPMDCTLGLKVLIIHLENKARYKENNIIVMSCFYWPKVKGAVQ